MVLGFCASPDRRERRPFPKRRRRIGTSLLQRWTADVLGRRERDRGTNAQTLVWLGALAI